MTWKRRLAAWAAMAFAAAVLWVFTMPSYRQGEPAVAGRKAEDFAVVVGGRHAKLSDFRGKVVVLNFWASYCVSCVEEIPDLDRLQQRIAGRGASAVYAGTARPSPSASSGIVQRCCHYRLRPMKPARRLRRESARFRWFAIAPTTIRSQPSTGIGKCW